MTAAPGIALVGTLDTKGAEIAYVRDRLLALGTQPVVVDSGILGEPGCTADVGREEVARAGGHDIDEVRRAGSRGAAVELMLVGVRATCLRLYAEGRIHGLLGTSQPVEYAEQLVGTVEQMNDHSPSLQIPDGHTVP